MSQRWSFKLKVFKDSKDSHKLFVVHLQIHHGMHKCLYRLVNVLQQDPYHNERELFSCATRELNPGISSNQ